jgi:hypothetical protein
MKRWALFLVAAIALSVPAVGHAQSSGDSLGPNQYQDVNDAQLLRLAAYMLTPVGMGLEWGLMRPMHYLATDTVIAPLLSGDYDRIGFGHNNNADLVPLGTFDPAPMNLTNDYVPSKPETGSSVGLKESIVPAESSKQSAIH